MRDRVDDQGPGAAAPAAADDAGGPGWAVPGVTTSAEATVERPVSVATADDTRASVLAGLGCASPQVVTLAGAVAALVDQDCLGDLGTAAQLNDDVIGLAGLPLVAWRRQPEGKAAGVKES